MSMRFKILAGFLILSSMLFVAGALSVKELSEIGASVQALLDENYKSINASKKMIEALEREDSGVLLLLSGKWEEGRVTIEPANEQFREAFDVARNNITIPGEKSLVDAIEKKYQQYEDLWIRPIVGTPREGNLTWYFQEVHQVFQEVKLSVEQLMSLNDRTMYQTASQLKNRAHRAIMPGIVAIVAAFVFTAIFNYFIHCFVVRPITHIIREIESFIRSGQPMKFKIETKDEIARLANAIHELELTLRKEA
ncbi:MAG: hypothetical protein JSW39_13940 [Desulfobacterales bacterium]|nr:MAG: hypothetical protein JSW39_13940 [Desulfobacterales bacterium]